MPCPAISGFACSTRIRRIGRTNSSRPSPSARKVARYVDIPLQHIHENMLERMRRETSKQYIVDLLAAHPRRRAGHRACAPRSSSASPGETEASFNDLLEFIAETKFERLGVFAYSKEDGTRAGAMAGQISDKVKQRRRELAMAAQHQIAKEVSESFVGRTLKVLVEGKASAKQLAAANVSSWEHGLMREADTSGAKLAGGRISRRAWAKPTRRTLTDAFMSAASCRSASLPR
jgi:tRNA A37 methylthiotransferase MiaB